MPVAETNPNLYSGSFIIEGGNFNSAGIVSTSIKSTLKKLGIPGDIVRKAAIVSYEAEINVVSYAKKGVMTLTVEPGIVRIEVADEGPHSEHRSGDAGRLFHADQRIREMGFGAGMGLCNIKNYSDAFQIESEVGKGTRLKMTITTP
jgi:anti-sigma regulatory factor (Ser/Thr protein kinase)